MKFRSLFNPLPVKIQKEKLRSQTKFLNQKMNQRKFLKLIKIDIKTYISKLVSKKKIRYYKEKARFKTLKKVKQIRNLQTTVHHFQMSLLTYQALVPQKGLIKMT